MHDEPANTFTVIHNGSARLIAKDRDFFRQHADDLARRNDRLHEGITYAGLALIFVFCAGIAGIFGAPGWAVGAGVLLSAAGGFWAVNRATTEEGR